MNRSITSAISFALISLVSANCVAQSQYVAISTPFQTINDSFFERMGVDFDYNGRGFNFNQGSFDSAIPPFGNYDPNTVGRWGISNGPFKFRFEMGQGSDRSIVSQTPTVVVPNGGFGSVTDQTIRPFVTGVVPVVGGGGAMVPIVSGFPSGALPVPMAGGRTISPLQQALARLNSDPAARQEFSDAADEFVIKAKQARASSAASAPSERSSAEHGDLSVAEIRRRQAAESNSAQQELNAIIQRAREAEAANKKAVARIYYEQAARRAAGELKQHLIDKVRSLK